jgi:membrane associated rhomboid family serine protease
VALLDDILKLLGTNRTRVQWKVRSWKRGWERRKAAVENRTAAPRTSDRARRLVRLLWSPDAPMVTTLIAISCIATYATVLVWQKQVGLVPGPTLQPHTYALWRFGSEFSPDILDKGQWWRLMTATFLHGGILHIVMNMMSLWSVGVYLEDTLGKAKTLALYLLLGACASTFSLWWHTHDGGIGNSVGASGAICGLIGVAIGFSMRHRNAARHLQSHYVGWAIWIVILGMSGMRIDNAGHVGGLVPGVLLGLVVRRRAATSLRVRRLWAAAAIAALAATVACFVLMARSTISDRDLFASEEPQTELIDDATAGAITEAQKTFEPDDDYLPQSHAVHYAFGRSQHDRELDRRMRRLFGEPTRGTWKLRDRATGVQLRIFEGDDTWRADGDASDAVVAHLTALLQRATPAP